MAEGLGECLSVHVLPDPSLVPVVLAPSIGNEAHCTVWEGRFSVFVLCFKKTLTVICIFNIVADIMCMKVTCM